jgi:hypothetical protein
MQTGGTLLVISDTNGHFIDGEEWLRCFRWSHEINLAGAHQRDRVFVQVVKHFPKKHHQIIGSVIVPEKIRDILVVLFSGDREPERLD